MEPNELPCQEVVALVTEYLEQTLLPEMQTKVDEHLAGCSGCTTSYEQMQQTIAMLRRLSQEPTLPETREALLQKFRQWRDNRGA
jgi:predicted anti-sigma-YlaC factor YlaD